MSLVAIERITRSAERRTVRPSPALELRAAHA